MKKLITALSILCASFALQAAYSDYYVMFSVCAPGQIPIAKSSIDGVRLHLIYGDVQNLNGFDFGLGCGRVREHMNGLQIGGGNVVGTDVAGAQLGLVNWANTMTGLQIGLLNFIDDDRFLYVFPFVNGRF